MSVILSWSLRAAAALVLTFFALPLRAQPLEALVVDNVQRGVRALQNGELEECAQAFTAALTLRRDRTTAGELGICEEALGWHVLAYDHLVFALEGEPPAAAGAQPWARFREALRRAQARVALAIVLVNPDEARVSVDGRPLGTHVDGRFFALAPGRHTWIAHLDGRPDATFVHTVRAGDMPSIHLSLARPASPPARCVGACLSPPSQAPAAPSPQGASSPVLGLFLGGVLSAGLTASAGAGFWLAVEARFHDERDWGFALAAEARLLAPALSGIRPTGRPFHVGLMGGAVSLCARFHWLLGCGVLDAGAVFASSPQTATFSPPDLLGTLALGPRLSLDVPVDGHVSLRALAELRLSPFTDAVYREGSTVLWNNPLASALFAAGLRFQ